MDAGTIPTGISLTKGLMIETKSGQVVEEHRKALLTSQNHVGLQGVTDDGGNVRNVMDSRNEDGNNNNTTTVPLVYTNDHNVTAAHILPHGNCELGEIGYRKLSYTIINATPNVLTESESTNDTLVKSDPVNSGKNIEKGDNFRGSAEGEHNIELDFKLHGTVKSSLTSDFPKMTDGEVNRKSLSNENPESELSDIESDDKTLLDEGNESDSADTDTGKADDEMSEDNESIKDTEKTSVNEKFLREMSQISMIGYPNEEEENNRLEALKIAISLQAEAAQLRRIQCQRKQGELTRRRIILSERQKRNRHDNNQLGVGQSVSFNSNQLLSDEHSSGKFYSTDFKFEEGKFSSNAKKNYPSMKTETEMKSRRNTTQF